MGLLVNSVKIGVATLYCGDCREILPALQRPAAIVSDPPYGQQLHTNIHGKGDVAYGPLGARGGERVMAWRARAKNGVFRGSDEVRLWPENIKGDDKPFDPAPLLTAADRVLLWGAHKFADRLPPGSWLVWDKVPNGKVRDQGDGEAAWINDAVPRPLRIYRLLWDGVCVGSAARHEVTAGQKRVHPTQKPVALMRWCIAQARVPAGGVILDPYAGAGSTGVAAIEAGHPFIGIEAEPIYFDTMCRRVEDAQKQGVLFNAAPTVPRPASSLHAAPCPCG
jgi:site-specific DNA-methyltransferase (adenine-specific)/modification methylase